ncbi:hypothetical protein GQ43DRAFT_474528 [Delitschia confertaspora ATCC 74209]|uniref:Uncharacterized protein n=1 Tax=Delitschia confertaspora ATCC 74209 TaxID=1513339 RepID=A0A9P4MPN5_9PLEO|nr:hypothetical protein GQ43DRAFT_474528 [Delitschia confertaspora ATCC 74209]
MDIVKAFEDQHIPAVQVRAENLAADIELFVRNQVQKLRNGEYGKTLYISSNELVKRVIGTPAKKAVACFFGSIFN